MIEKNALKAKVRHYRVLTKKALEKVEIKAKEGTPDFKRAEDFLEMANNYFNDAKHFEESEKLLLALAAYSYAHAWLDAGVRSGILDGKEDDQLFTLP
ncbi:MAG: hypothetical protein CL943_00190 [Candidatus Diapherotrites archaeon]|uniref:DUF357 domain-containing protein n=1 Tax=Candidatus Iainarchaeum sp. TaxID=3101447 RepID=A0A2D6LZW3_9ARCH|nr:hypothetical protein [Candidatus Diapherotrites archaeon]